MSDHLSQPSSAYFIDEGHLVLQPADTVWYLGYRVGLRYLHNRNLLLRIWKLERRLILASRVDMSVQDRVLIRNSIILPSVLFTAAIFDMPEWTRREFHILYKQFLWDHATSTEASLHKINRGLLFTPKKVGGWLGLIGGGH